MRPYARDIAIHAVDAKQATLIIKYITTRMIEKHSE